MRKQILDMRNYNKFEAKKYCLYDYKTKEVFAGENELYCYREILTILRLYNVNVLSKDNTIVVLNGRQLTKLVAKELEKETKSSSAT